MISILNLGRCDYATALRLQETLVELRKQNRVGNVLLFVEHPPVITLGRNARQANIVAPRELLTARGVEIHEINRGGDVTFHGPGQLVAYPIFDLRSFEPRLGVIDYVRRLEEVLMRVCAQYTIETQRICGMTGVWTFPTIPPRLNPRKPGRDYTSSEMTGAPGSRRALCGDNLGSRNVGDIGFGINAADATTAGGPHPPSVGECGEQPTFWTERKIAAIGVHISRGVTSHGFALNVTTDLDFFQLIVPCGLTKPVTSIEFETGLRPSLDEVMTVASRTFGELFRSQMLWLESIHDLIPAGSIPEAQDTPARAPENERRIAGDDTHLA
jgi:lipoyl(octanoyl) transferase